jgi:ABC-type Fe3+ transport system substrate-binding protein
MSSFGQISRGAVLGGAIVLACAATARAETIDEIYAKAKAEKTLVFDAGGPTAPWEAAAKIFGERYPGITVSINGGFSNVLDQQIDAQLKAKKLDVDMAFFQTVQDFVRWKKEGALLPFKPDGFDKIDAHFKDKAGAYVGVSVNAHSYAYNADLVKPADVPRSALDFLKPEFRGKLVAAYPQDDDATLYDFDSIQRKYGWSYMKKYMANQPNFIQGHLGVVRSISAGQNLVTLDTIVSMSLGEKALGKPQAIAFSTIDPLPIWPLTAGIFKLAPHPNAAKLFLNWYLSPEEQAQVGTWSSRSDVAPPDGLKPLSAYKVVNSYREFLTDDKHLAELRKRYAELVGPIKNAGGVR